MNPSRGGLRKTRHASVWVVVSTLQVPAMHRGVITSRERVPLSSHVEAKPPHVDHEPVWGAPQSVSTKH